MERRVDEYITRGYRIKSQGKESTHLKERDWGDSGVHLFFLLFTGWWSFGFINALYAIYKYATADELILKIDSELETEQRQKGDTDYTDTQSNETEF